MKARSTRKRLSVSAPPPRRKADPRRCRFTSTDGRRCQMPRSANHATLCLAHARQEQELAQAGQDLSQELVSLSGNLKTASDVNHVLRKLFSLLAQRRISRRDAIAFAYIAQLILQTLPGVKREVQQVQGDDAWRETVEAAVGPWETEEEDDADEDKEEDEQEENSEDRNETGANDVESSEANATENSAYLEGLQEEIGHRPTSLSELARMILARHAKSHGLSPPTRVST
jgi:hypothetical protein